MAMNEWKNIHCLLYKADTPRLRSTMQNICFLISISAVTLKLMVKITSIFGSYRFLRIAWHDIFLLSDLSDHFPASWNLYTMYPAVILRSRRENAHLLVNPIPKLTIVLIWKTPACLKFGKTSNRGVEIWHKENSESEQRTMHVLIRIWSHRTSGSVCFVGNDRSSHSRIRINLDPMFVYYEWASD